MLDFLATTDMGERATAGEDDAVSEVCQLEVREWMEEQGVALRSRTGRAITVPSHARLHGVRRNRLDAGRYSVFFPSFFLLPFTLALLSFVIYLVRTTSSGDRPGRMAKGCLQRAATARTVDRKRPVHHLAMISLLARE